MSQFTTEGQHTLETSYGPVRYWDHGPGTGGPPLVFLQGFLAAPEVWSDVVAELTGQHRCITVDWPFGAHFQPLAPDADLSPPGVARLAIEVLDRLEVPSAVLVGNDSGGVIAQLVASAHPGRVSALVLVACDAFECFPPGAYRHLFRLAALPGTVRLLAWAMSVPAIARSHIGFGAVIARDPGRARRWTIPLATNSGVRRDAAKLMKGSSKTQTLGAARRFADFAQPVLVVWAGQDRLFPRSLGERLAAAFPHGRFELVDDSATFIPCDQPHSLAAILAGFLAPDAAR
ncbi:MAG: alpha/beta hydrolase [Streptosporangiaceae bacterium]